MSARSICLVFSPARSQWLISASSIAGDESAQLPTTHDGWRTWCGTKRAQRVSSSSYTSYSTHVVTQLLKVWLMVDTICCRSISHVSWPALSWRLNFYVEINCPSPGWWRVLAHQSTRIGKEGFHSTECTVHNVKQVPLLLIFMWTTYFGYFINNIPTSWPDLNLFREIKGFRKLDNNLVQNS